MAAELISRNAWSFTFGTT